MTQRVWWPAFGYFAFYVPYSARTKALERVRTVAPGAAAKVHRLGAEDILEPKESIDPLVKRITDDLPAAITMLLSMRHELPPDRAAES